jgi:hypothetical protein
LRYRGSLLALHYTIFHRCVDVRFHRYAPAQRWFLFGWVSVPIPPAACTGCRFVLRLDLLRSPFPAFSLRGLRLPFTVLFCAHHLAVEKTTTTPRRLVLFTGSFVHAGADFAASLHDM